jgi:hypothetical protein
MKNSVQNVERALIESAAVKVGGMFEVECYDRNGNLKWNDIAKNLVVNAGLDHVLDVIFHGTTQVNPWYVGLKLTGTVKAADTLSSHASWSEATVYSGNRPAYVEAAASGQSITNSANKASFTIDAAATIAGAFVASASAGTSGTLMCGANFTAPRGVESGDTLEVAYTISAADDGV